MKIAATMVSMDATRNYTEVDQHNTVWQQGNSNPFSFSQPSQSSSGKDFQENFFTLIHSSSTSKQFGTSLVTSTEEFGDGLHKTESPGQNQARNQALSSMVQKVSGSSVTVNQVSAENRNQKGGSSEPLSMGFASLNSSLIHVEEEAVCFQAGGTVQTECGQTISFNMGLQMERQDVSIQSAGLASSIFAIDPLVLNFDENISIFDDTFFTFDLDGDGSSEVLSGLGAGCGFLALDRNGDGTISDGLELFGPATDNGFAELAELDNDGNSWIDENDAIFDDLFVWMGAGGENENLVSLRDTGVGAISVAHLGTQFNLEGQDGVLQGVVQATGLFLMENGEPKSLQEIDLVTNKVDQEGDELANGVPVDAATQGSLGTFNTVAGRADIQTAMDNLREIISWQRFKMRMMMGKAMSKSPQEEMVERLEHLVSGLMFSLSFEENTDKI